MKKFHMSKARSIFVMTVVGAVLFAVPAIAGKDVKITSAAFKYNGVRYFRGKAENVNLASYGEKKTPVGQPNYLEVEDDIGRAMLGKIKVKISGPYDVDWSRYSKADISAGIKYLMVGGGTGSFSHESAKSAKLKLVKMSIDEGQLKKLLNDHAQKVKAYMKSEGKDARIVSEVWIAMEAQLASDVTNGGAVTGSGGANGITVEVSASGSSKNTSSVTIPENTTFAYLLHKVKKWKKDTISNMEDDQHGAF
ncbi:MAG: hypothetical protein JXR76_24610 [Deltaproteobacteria bacterium]|nr:hypothetical protein [Deltaproteobacteria bacterium]